MQGFDAVERRPWTVEVTLIELMKQVGDLSKHVMVQERYYLSDRDADPGYVTSTRDIADELADILYCVMRIADHYGVDLVQAHMEARRAELRALGID
jgi:NTP pyrophosphatase (non-canonical NTP hydrolase)